ncbi:hypothetical protein N9937_01040 [bacterium]|nr:hypothetical protein [bacterium]
MDKMLAHLDSCHNDNMDAIKMYTSKTEPCYKDYVKVVRAILQCPENPYSYLPNGWQSIHSSSSCCASFCMILCHAMVDDGEVSFLEDNKGRSHIIFASLYDFDNQEMWEQFVRKESSVWNHCQFETHNDVDRFITGLTAPLIGE